MNCYLLPGFHGTDSLWAPFIQKAPSWANAVPLKLPTGRDGNYPLLASHLIKKIDASSPSILIAESFSGPLATLLADELKDNVRLLVMGNTFVVSPLGWPGKFLPLSLVSSLPLTRLAAKLWLTGGNQLLAEKLCEVVGKIPKATYAARLKAVVNVDVSKEYASLECPILVLRGENDRIVGSRFARQLIDLNRRAALKEIETAHMVYQLRPEESWRAIEERIDREY